MRKLRYGILIGLGLAVVVLAVFFAAPFVSHLTADNVSVVSKPPGEKQTGKLAGAAYRLSLDDQSNEGSVVQVMHEMTHQKVKADQKWGAIEMTAAHINVVFNIVKNSHFDDKTKLLEIATRWKNGDFTQVVDEHNYLWSLQNGNVGKAYDKMTREEEKTFVWNNFGDTGHH